MTKQKRQPQTFRIINQEVLSNCYSCIAQEYASRKEGEHLSVRVGLMTEEEAKSAAQHGLYWHWMTYLSNKTGDTKDDIHLRSKWQFLKPIYERDKPSYAEMLVAVETYKQHATKAEFANMAKSIAKETSIKTATLKQMAEYMTDLDQYYYSQGYPLPKPDDYDWMMGGDK